MTSPNQWTVLAIRYGTLATLRSHQFYRYEVYGEPDGPLQMDYFFWLLDNGQQKILVDSGFHPDAIRDRPGRVCLIPPVEALKNLGVDCDEISTVVVTHLHYDHIGNLAAFPNARFVVQRRELAYWTGPHGGRLPASASVEAAEIAYLADAADAGRVDLIDGDHTVAPGVQAILTGGHCPGQQVVRIDGERPVVLCSDALHFTEEMERYMPFSVFFDLAASYEAYELFRRWRDDGAVIVAGHDPAVMSEFPAASGAEGLAVRVR